MLTRKDGDIADPSTEKNIFNEIVVDQEGQIVPAYIIIPVKKESIFIDSRNSRSSSFMKKDDDTMIPLMDLSTSM